MADAIINYTRSQVAALVRNFSEIFEVARLVDVSMTRQFELSEDEQDFIETEYNCYAVWNKEHRCENCVSAKAFAKKAKMTKFEFVDDDVYHVVAKYIIMDDKPFMLELVTKIKDETLFGAYGKEKFVETITNYNDKLYVDPLTHAFNRNYYSEQLSGLSKVAGIAMMDLDKFKDINDSFGHDAGDEVLKGVVGCVQSCIRQNDAVIRYGGDEFIMIFKEISQDDFVAILQRIRMLVRLMKIEAYPEIKATVSIGGYYCDGEEGLAPLKIADERLYEAKKKRNCVVCF